MVSKFVILAGAVILAAPIVAATGGSSSAGGSSTAGAGGHSGGGGGDAGHGGATTGGVGRSGGLSGRAAAATAPSSRAGTSHTDAVHAGEHTTSKSPGNDHHHHPYRLEPDYGVVMDQPNFPCAPTVAMNNTWFDCNRPTKSVPGHKS